MSQVRKRRVKCLIFYYSCRTDVFSLCLKQAGTMASLSLYLHMIAFIQQEAAEKVEEIEAKAEEEFNIEKKAFSFSTTCKNN